MLGTDGDAASALACQLFDSVMEAEGVGVPAATVYDGPRAGAVEGTVRRVVGDVDGTDESLSDFVNRVAQLVERETRLAASSTMEGNVERAARTKAGRRVRFARVPTRSVPCPWCAMLASRGFVYWSSESAEAGSHHHCTCTIVPGVQGSTKVAGYDTEHYKDVWLNRERYEGVAASAQASDAESARSERKAAHRLATEEEKERRRVAALSDEAKSVFESERFVETFGTSTASGMETAIEDAMRSGDARRANAARLLSRDIRDGFEVESVTARKSMYLTGTRIVRFDPDGAQSTRTIAHELAHRRDHLSVLPGGSSPTPTGGWSSMGFGKDGVKLSERFEVDESGVTPAWRDLKRRLVVESDAEVMAKIYEANPDIADHPSDFVGLSDIIHAASNGKKRIKAGHFWLEDASGNVIRDGDNNPVPYWNDTTRVIETWADYSAALVTSEREARLIQELFPDEAAIMDAMMEVMVQ